jgi:hypothetical protein
LQKRTLYRLRKLTRWHHSCRKQPLAEISFQEKAPPLYNTLKPTRLRREELCCNGRVIIAMPELFTIWGAVTTSRSI